MLADLENLDIMLGENHFNETEREESLNSTSMRRRKIVASNNLENQGESSYSDLRNANVRTNAHYGQNSADMSSQAEINRLSSELNSRLSREMDDMMNNVSSQIQRAINDAISTQVLPQIQNVIMAGSGRVTRKGWGVPAERRETNPELHRNLNARNNLRNEKDDGHQNGDLPSHNVHDMVAGDNESSIVVPEFLTGRIPSQNHLDQSYEVINLDTTIPAQEKSATSVEPDKLADWQTS